MANWARLYVPMVLVASGAANYFAWSTPYFLITEQVLNSHEYSVFTSITSLNDGGNTGLAIFISSLVVGF
jgi:hypothetical protein